VRHIVLGAVACVAALTTVAAGQAPDLVPARYTAIVTAYRSGSGGAVGEIAAWTRADIERALPVAAAGGTLFAEAAAMLHTEAAVAAAATDWARGSVHLGAAEALLRSLPASTEDFSERYYAFIPTLFLAHGDPDSARLWVERGLRLFQYSAPIRTASGMIEELVAHLGDPECVGRECAAGRNGTLAGARLAAAEREYRIALERDPAFLEARLRLGRVLALQGNERDANVALAAVTENGSPRLRYLAHLFRGAIAVGGADVATARREYAAAMTALPGCQTPYLALSQIEEAAGNLPRARDLVSQVARLGNDAVADPWWTYQNGGLDRDTLQWLIDYVR
jgi:hypothetical protein